MTEMLLGVDLGTSSAKAVFFTSDGCLAASGSESYGIDSPHPRWAEQSPEVWWRAVLGSIRKASAAVTAPYRIRGIGLSGQMHGLVCLDRAKNVLRPAIIWADQRSGREATEINDFLSERRLYDKTLNKASSGFLLPSLLWVVRNEPAIAREIAHVLLPKDYIRFRLSGDLATEFSDACGTGAFDVAGGRWFDELLEYFSVSRHIMPPVLCSSACVGKLSTDVADSLGLEAGIFIAAGAGDQAAQAVGNGLIAPGLASSNIGTAGQFFIASEKPLYDSKLRCNCFNHAHPDLWYLLGANLSAGFSLKWLWKNVLGREEDYEGAARLAAAAPAGSRGLLFHPYLNGDRTPHQDAEASASFIGLSGSHGAPEMVRSVMEGVAFSMREGLEIARSMGLAPSRIVASGGGARSSLWRQIQADVYNTPVAVTEVKEQACMGAAILAGVAGGVFGSIADGCGAMVRSREELTEPNRSNVALYEEMYVSGYRDFYENNRRLYSKLFQWR